MNVKGIKSPVSPQKAMDDYFQDMFRCPDEDPLKKRLLNESASKQAKTQVQNTVSDVLPRLENLPKKQADASVVTHFAEPIVETGRISPLIIPAAFPKLAPVSLEQVTQSNEKSPPQIKTHVQTKTAPKLKTDKKTALALLLKHQHTLSKEQKRRLKEKLNLVQKKTVQAAQVITEPEISLKEPLKQAAAPVQTKQPVAAPEKAPLVTETLIQQVSQSQEKLALPEKAQRPPWLDRRFECLLFSVAGLKLAVPLMSLGAIYKIEKEMTPLVGRASWFMGLYHHLDRNVRVIDTAQWVMPERCHAAVRDNYQFIIRLGDSDWGMACDAVHESIQLYPDQVKWRSERTKRAWLYGTVIEHMCALIDAEAFNLILNQQGTKQQNSTK